MRYENGWVKLHRSIRKKELYQDPRLILLVVELLLISNYEKSKILLKTGLRELLPGQTLVSMRKLGKTTGVPHATVERLLNKLEMYEFLRQEVTHRGTIVTICNWERYQENEKQSETDIETQVRHERDTLETQVRHQKEIKKERKKEIKKEDLNTLTACSDEQRCEVESDPPLILEKVKKEKKPKSDGSKVWEAYAQAYQEVYKVPPIRNAKTNAICSKLVDRLGAEIAPQVANFFVGHRDRFYCQKMHSLNLLLADCEKIHTEMQKGVIMTSTWAQHLDKRHFERTSGVGFR